MNVLWIIIVGFIVGLVARMLMPGKDPAGFLLTTGLGVIGAVVGHFLGRAMGFYLEGEPVGFFMAVLGAILVLFVYKKIAQKPSEAYSNK